MQLQLECYLVGGAVRDTLLGREVGDRDWVVVGSSVAEMLQLGFTQVGRDFPVFLHPQTHEEYALARTEKQSGAGHTGFVVHASPEVTLQQDLLRRDLTINAMAMDADGRLIDEFGGQQDLARRRLRHVSPAFAEDPLRVLRVARFAAQLPGFTVATETAALMRSMCAAGALDTLSAERVWTETVKALAAQAANRYWQVLADCGALQPWFAELQDAVARGELEEVPGELGALGRFVHLPLNAQQLAGFCQRLKVSKHFQQVAEDQRAFGALLVNWPQAQAQAVCDMLTRLQVHHDRRRLDNLLQVSPDAVAADALRVLAEGFAQVRLEPAPPPGPAYGQALAAARLAQVEAGLAGPLV